MMQRGFHNGADHPRGSQSPRRSGSFKLDVRAAATDEPGTSSRLANIHKPIAIGEGGRKGFDWLFEDPR